MPTQQTRIQKTSIIRLSVKDQRVLMEVILNPPEPNCALRKAAEAYKRLVVESR